MEKWKKSMNLCRALASYANVFLSYFEEHGFKFFLNNFLDLYWMLVCTKSLHLPIDITSFKSDHLTN